MTETIVANGNEISAHPTSDESNHIARKLAASLDRGDDRVSHIMPVCRSGIWVSLENDTSFHAPEQWEIEKSFNHDTGGTSVQLKQENR